MDLLSDFGGFNDALFFIVSTLISAFSARMYESSLSSEIWNQTKSLKKQDKINNLRSKIVSQENFELNQSNYATLQRVIEHGSEQLKIPMWKMLCYFKLCCRKDGKYRAMRRTVDQFEDCLDIRKLVETHLNLNLLLKVLLTPPQQFLFMHHYGRAIPHVNSTLTSDDY